MPGLSHLEKFLCLFSNAFSQIPVRFTHATVKMMPWPWQTEEERGGAELCTRATNSPNLNFIFTPELPSRLEQNCCLFSSLSKVIVPAMWACRVPVPVKAKLAATAHTSAIAFPLELTASLE